MAMLRPIFISILALGVITPSAVAACDISETKCALNGGKCNIKFRNQSGEGSGSGGPTELWQKSAAQGIKVKALKENGKTAGNVLSIDAGASKTMNIDKKANKSFAKIRITAPTMDDVEAITMRCDQVQAVLNGNGTCKVFVGQTPIGEIHGYYKLGFNCDGGNVAAPQE